MRSTAWLGVVTSCLALAGDAPGFTLVDLTKDAKPGTRTEEGGLVTTELWNLAAQVRSVGVSGATSYSFLRDGVFYETLVDGTSITRAGDREWVTEVGLRVTDDPRVDERSVRLTKLHQVVSAPRHQLELGDVFVSCSELSMTSLIKGARGQWELGSSTRATVFGGTNDRSWETLMGVEDRLDFRRDTYGLRLAREGRYGETGYTFVRADDSAASARGGGFNPMESSVHAFDARLGLGSWYARLEGALSQGNEEGGPERDGQAFVLDASRSDRRQAMSVRFRRLSPDFLSLEGTAVSDYERADGSYQLKLSPRATARVAYEDGRNFLDLPDADSLRVREPSYALDVKVAAGLMFRAARAEREYDGLLQGLDVRDLFSLTLSSRRGTYSLAYLSRDADWDAGTTDFRDEAMGEVRLGASRRCGSFTPSVFYGRRNQTTDDAGGRAQDQDSDDVSATVDVDLKNRRSLRLLYGVASTEQRVVPSTYDERVTGLQYLELGTGIQVDLQRRDNRSSDGAQAYREDVASVSWRRRF